MLYIYIYICIYISFHCNSHQCITPTDASEWQSWWNWKRSPSSCSGDFPGMWKLLWCRASARRLLQYLWGGAEIKYMSMYLLYISSLYMYIYIEREREREIERYGERERERERKNETESDQMYFPTSCILSAKLVFPSSLNATETMLSISIGHSVS